MKKEYLPLIEKYCSEKYFLYTRTISESEWGKKELAEEFFLKYWLPYSEYEEIWKSIQNNIFTNQDKGLPELIFEKHFDILALRGGCLFLEEDFCQLQQCLLEIGEIYFVVIQNDFGGKLKEPTFRMKFPVDITWKELMSGNFISVAMFEMFHNEYFVFGESENWGKYSANDYELPLDLIGVKPNYSKLFLSKINQSEEERREINDWLPLKYKGRIFR